MTTVFELLKEDHRKVEAAFAEFKRAADDAAKTPLVQSICHELKVHALVEETFVYPELSKVSQGGGELQTHSLEEHERIENAVTRLEQATSQYDADMAELEEAVTHHVHEEETRVFPALEASLDPEYLNTLTHQVYQAKATE